MSAKAGRQDNQKLERRDDVVTFTSAPLGTALDVLGAPHLMLHLKTASTARPDLFVRLCEVDARGRSWNVTESFTHLTTPSERLSLRLGSCAHRFRAGHRIRLQISGGAYPRLVRNPAPCSYTLICPDSYLVLPTEPPQYRQTPVGHRTIYRLAVRSPQADDPVRPLRQPLLRVSHPRRHPPCFKKLTH
jgi:putative CocE/NonD family hydrolase